MKTETQVYKLWSYDVWGNAKDDWWVNDRFYQGKVTIVVKATTFNAGTPQEFISFTPSDYQLNRALGVKGLIWDGEADYALYGETKSGKPVCELIRV